MSGLWGKHIIVLHFTFGKLFGIRKNKGSPENISSFWPKQTFDKTELYTYTFQSQLISKKRKDLEITSLCLRVLLYVT